MGPGHRIVTILCDSGMRHLSKFWAQVGPIGGKDDVTFDDVINAPKVQERPAGKPDQEWGV